MKEVKWVLFFEFVGFMCPEFNRLTLPGGEVWAGLTNLLWEQSEVELVQWSWVVLLCHGVQAEQLGHLQMSRDVGCLSFCCGSGQSTD